ncbi:MAG: hypothetical protein ABSH56_14705 [Bryobacteraceae bacterium]
MNIDEVNENILEDLASQHRSYFVTGMHSEILDQADLAEVVLYAYGAHAGGEDAEEFRSELAVREHEGNADCEISRHFWRGVCEARRAEFGVHFNKKQRQRTATTGHPYPKFKVRGTQLLLGRLYDFFLKYSAFPDVASEHFEEQIDSEKGFVLLTGMPAKKAVYSLYNGAHIGSRLEKAREVMDWRPLSGWDIGAGPWAQNPRVPDLSKIKQVPPVV